MNTACVISVGNELLSGLTIDTNAPWLARRLMEMGIPTAAFYTAPDDSEEIVQAIIQAVLRADIILITGGLGPTDDDITRNGLADFLGVELELRQELVDQIDAFFKSRNRTMAETNRVQAYMPSGAESLTNEIGTAPGILAEHHGQLLVSMPGVPNEMKRMFENSVLDRIKSRGSGQIVVSGKVHCFGAGESIIAHMLGDMMERGRNPLINCTCADGFITLHIVATADNKKMATEMIAKKRARICEKLGDIVYGHDDQTLPQVVADTLKGKGLTIATAESCTGGLLAKLLTDIPGSSGYFTHGWVTYSNRAKIEQLNVPADLIEKHGAVSEQVARAMAAGARKNSGSDVGIGITGIAGPDGGTEQKPVGLVYISMDIKGESDTVKNIFTHSRAIIRQRAVLTALNMLRLDLH